MKDNSLPHDALTLSKLGPFLLPHQIGQVPDQLGGIYALKLRFPTNYELGIHPEAPVSPRSIKALTRFLGKVERAHHSVSMHGHLRNHAIGKHIRQAFALTATTQNEWKIRDTALESSIGDDPKKLLAFCSIARSMCNHLPPLYVGIAEQQSLRSRAAQHLSGETGLSERLRLLDIGFEDTAIECYPATYDLLENLRSWELLLQNTLRPSLSMQ